jgi:DNA-binding LacI/PurR family transcriptional regulator
MASDNQPKYKILEDTIRQRIKDQVYMGKIPSERNLADEFGVSYMTVRKAINNLVEEEVLYKEPKKGTFVNNRPKNLKTNIGFFLDRNIKKGIASAYYSMIYNALEKEAARQGHSVIYFSNNDPNNLDEVLKKLDGVIATCFPHNEEVIAYLAQRKPLVVIDNSSQDKTIPSVTIDNFNAIFNSVKYLSELGHRNIAFISGLSDSDVGRNRLNGYQTGLKRLELKSDPTLIFSGNYSFESGVAAADYFLSLDELPHAIISANDRMALGATQRLQQKGLSIPKDISVIGFDDIQVSAEVYPPLTTNAAPFEKIAQQTFTMLKTIIDGQELNYQHISLNAHLIERASCSPRLELIKKGG